MVLSLFHFSTSSLKVASNERARISLLHWRIGGAWPEEAIHEFFLQTGRAREHYASEISDRKLPRRKVQ